MQTLQEAMKTRPLQLNCCQVRFENTQEAAEANSKLLQECDNNFEVLTSKEPNTVITPGSEFQSIDTLEKIWKYHNNWQIIQKSITEGRSYSCAESPLETTKIADL